MYTGWTGYTSFFRSFQQFLLETLQYIGAESGSGKKKGLEKPAALDIWVSSGVFVSSAAAEWPGFSGSDTLYVGQGCARWDI